MKIEKFEPAADISWRDVEDELVALNTYTGEYYVFNSTGRLVWLAILEGKNISEIARQIAEEYNVNSEESIIEDIKSFVDEAFRSKLLIHR